MAEAIETAGGELEPWEALAAPAGVRVVAEADPEMADLMASYPGPLLVVAAAYPDGLFGPSRPPRGWAPPGLSESRGRRLVELLAEGYSVFCPAPSPAARTQPHTAPHGLSPREREVLDLVSAGWSNPEIARFLDISVHTVKYHLARLFERLEAANRAELVRRAAELGLLRL